MFRKSPVALAVLAASLSSLTATQSAVAEDIGMIRVESSTIDERLLDRRREPSSVAVISGETVDRAHVNNVQQMLQSVPGITTEWQSGDSLKIHIRGVENQRYMGEKPGVAVVIDGVPVFERTGRVNIDLDNIESIRVVKGGASYLFGEDALSGAVIITTKRGANNAGFKAAAEVGSFNYRKGLFRAGHAADDWAGHIQLSHRSTDAYHVDAGSEAEYVNGKLQYYIDDVSDVTFGFEVSDRAKDSHGTVEGVTQAANDPTSVAGRDYTRKYAVDLAKAFVTYSRDLDENGNLMVNAYQFTDDTAYISAPQKYDATGAAVTDVNAYTQDNDYAQVQRGVKVEWRSGVDQLGWLAGLDLRDNTYENKVVYLVDHRVSPSPRVPLRTAGTVVDDHETNEQVQAFYGELKWNPAEAWTFTLNGRHDTIDLDYDDRAMGLDLSKSFDVDSWRIGGNYQASARTSLFANASTGFRAPTVDQLFAGDISPTGDTAANPDLKPEEAINLELGVRSAFDFAGREHSVEAAIFQIDRDDYILNVAGQYSVPGAGVLDQYQNIGGIRNRGLELAINSDPAERLAWDVAYTYLDTEFTRYDNFNLILGSRYARVPTVVSYDLTGNEVPRAPAHRLNLSLKWKATPKLLLTGEINAQSEYWADEMNTFEIDGHATFNLLANYDHEDGAGRHWSWFARVDNVFDRRYYNTARTSSDRNADGVYDAEDISMVVNPGRTFTAGLSVDF